MEHKTLSLSDSQIKLEGEGNRFCGYASTFGNVDSYGDTILKGAYEETLSINGAPKMFFNHDIHGVPIGAWKAVKEDDHGLYVEGEFTPGNSLAEEVKAALKHGTVDGMSIGYRLKSGDYQETATGRIIKKVARLPEVSIVTYPADSFARVDLASVKSEVDEIKSIRDFELYLRDAGGVSKGLAKALVSRAKVLFSQRDVEESDQAKQFQELKTMFDSFKVPGSLNG
ncbi:HK97 family phage prohead protease [Herbaspirillum sp. GCM10030257]|uniref:HK97 family phage prohead protease n=1 Tax=Herbaspirillum sp. GCM10030257 TaxID=3273393 RepID=UPI00361C55E3